jgi:hypothetical protein
MNYWEMIADKLSASGWSWSYVSTVDSKGRTIFVAAQMHVPLSGKILHAFGV